MQESRPPTGIPRMTEIDRQLIYAVEKYLKQGWLITVAVKKAGLSVKEYKALKEIYPEFKMKIMEYYQQSKSGWVK